LRVYPAVSGQRIHACTQTARHGGLPDDDLTWKYDRRRLSCVHSYSYVSTPSAWKLPKKKSPARKIMMHVVEKGTGRNIP
jgi:hypothetical protein